MDKLTIATQVLLKLIETDKTGFDAEGVAGYAWEITDAMQAEADKRINKERPDVLLTKDKDGNCLHFHHEFGHKKCMDCGASLGEWQPDWSQAPEWAVAWAFDKNGATWWSEMPAIHGNIWDGCVQAFAYAPSFGYTGDWKDSLRERPHGF